jgi:hypothetical protein
MAAAESAALRLLGAAPWLGAISGAALPSMSRDGRSCSNCWHLSSADSRESNSDAADRRPASGLRSPLRTWTVTIVAMVVVVYK